MAIGYVYILINAAMPGYLKIGKTDRTTEERAAELSATTGVPTKFLVAHEVHVADCDRVEQLIHDHFSHARPSKGREFFYVPLKDAIRILNELAAEFPVQNVSATVADETCDAVHAIPFARNGYLFILIDAMNPSRLVIATSSLSADHFCARLSETTSHPMSLRILFQRAVQNYQLVQQMVDDGFRDYRCSPNSYFYKIDFKWAHEITLGILQKRQHQCVRGAKSTSAEN